ncbi:MAG: Photosystem II manganese-stabilizing polypeptide [Phormidesmis sp. RL_2_1]|nr:Photosystem II manganese-stabilizing polypeptide [Phormidesmis sp. RL_2_1]
MKYKALIAIVLTVCLGLLTACSSSSPVTSDQLSYDDIRGSGLANNCPQLTSTNLDAIAIEKGKSYQLRGWCLQPETFWVSRAPLMKGSGKSPKGRPEEKFVASKLLTRSSSTLDQISGALQIDPNGTVTLVARGGFDFQPVTVQLPDGERVPLLFTIKGLVAKSQDAVTSLSPATRLAGTFNVPPYRTSSFIDPKGRGLAVGYDAAVGIPIQADREKFYRQNNKSFDVDEGSIALQISRINQATGELSGLFESRQPSDTDFGSKEAMTVKIRGQFYGRIEPAIA